MKRAILTALIFLAFAGCSRETPKEKEQQVAARDTVVADTTWNGYPVPDSLLEAVTFDLNHDGTADTIRFFRPHGEWGDPGDFFRIDFALTGRRTFSFLDGWRYLDAEVDCKKLSSLSLLHASEISLLKMDTGSYAALAVGSDPIDVPTLTVFVIGADSVGKVYNSHLAVTDIADLDSDGRLEIVGVKGFGEFWGSNDSVDYTSYIPYSIFVLPTCESKSQEFLRQYNMEHYYVAESDSPQVVVHPRNGGKPFVMDEKEAYAGYGK